MRLKVPGEAVSAEVVRLVLDDRLVLAVSLHERIVDRLVADLAPPTEEELREDLRVDLAPCDVILDEMQHAAERGVLRDDGAVVLPRQMEHAQGVFHLTPKVAFAPKAKDRKRHSSGASPSPVPSVGSSVRVSPSTAISSGSSVTGSGVGGASILRTKTCSAPALILRRSVCSVRTLTWTVFRSASNVASA